MSALLVAGSLTRDQIRIDGDRWPQPGGAPWHVGLSIGPTVAGLVPGDSVFLLGQAGPWAFRFALPALEATGLGLSVARTECDTIFINDYRPRQRVQHLLSCTGSLAAADLPSAPIAAATVSPLYAEALMTDFVPALRARGTFVGLDAQGLLRRVGAAGLVETAAPSDLMARLAGAQAVKFSSREFGVVPFLGRSHDVPATMFAGAIGVELLITHGVGGAQLFLPGGGSIDARTSSPSVGTQADETSHPDTTGAGDVFLAAYTYARGGGSSPADALSQATEFAAGLVRRRQRSVIYRSALLEQLRRLQESAI